MVSAAFMVSAVAAATGGAVGSEPASSRPATEIVVDTTAVPEMAAYGKRVKKVAEQWYPKIINMLPGDGFEAPRRVTIVFKEMEGVAYTQNDQITCSAKWFKERPEDVGAVVHELAHVVQHYTTVPRPGWLVEGIADYVRWFVYEPETARPHPKAGKAHYDGSYRTSAAFLDWAQRTYDPQLIVKLNTACRSGIYTNEVWKTATGKSMEELGKEWEAGLPTAK